jgi:hypothetical protein
MVAAAAIAFVVLNATRTRENARAMVRVMLAIAVVVALIAVCEAAQVQGVLWALTTFRPGFHVVGGQLRATSTLAYPTIASMYLELVFCLGLWLLIDGGVRDRASRSLVAWAALVIVAAGIVATFTRAGLLAAAAALVLTAALHYFKVGRLDPVHARLAALAVALALLIAVSRSPDALLARLRVEGSQQWYGVTYKVPASLTMATGAEYQVPITLDNTGQVVWDSGTSPMFALSYHWLRPDGSVVVFEGWRTMFDTPVAPGMRVTIPADVKAPGEPGDYVLVWDLVHEHRAWLSTEGVAPARSHVTVSGENVGVLTSPMARLPGTNVRLGRFSLWRAATRIASEHPVLGIGPDNFRLVYGRYAGLTSWDRRVHANNMYLEVLVGAGVIGVVAFMTLLTTLSHVIWRRWRAATALQAAPFAALAAAWVAVAGHGIVDSFLSFTTTYVMFALAVGLALSPGLADADRV